MIKKFGQVYIVYAQRMWKNHFHKEEKKGTLTKKLKLVLSQTNNLGMFGDVIL